MSQNQQIINYLNRFSDSMFPVAKHRERVMFQRNVETLFGTNNLTNIGTDNPTPPLGNLLFWEEGNTEHCGIAIAKNGYKVYSITQQKGLTELPQGARALEVSILLNDKAVQVLKNEYDAKKRKVFEGFLYQAAITLCSSITFGQPFPPIDPNAPVIPLFYSKRWNRMEEVVDNSNNTTGTFIIKDKKDFDSAILEIVSRPENLTWVLDCAMFIQACHAHAMVSTYKQYGEKDVIATRAIETDSLIQFKQIGSFWMRINERYHKSSFSETQFKNLKDNLVNESLEQLLTNAPIGSRVCFTNNDATVPESAAFKHENTMKVGVDSYAALGLGSPNCLYTQAEVSLALAQVPNRSADQIYVNANIYISTIEHLNSTHFRK